MEIRQLQYFLAIAQDTSMTEASKKLHVSQSTLSSSIKALENELGFPLFDRDGKRLLPNANGEYFAERAHAALLILEEASKVGRKHVHQRQFVINCVLDAPIGYAGMLIRNFQNEYPNVVVRMGSASSELFTNQTIDLRITTSQTKLNNDNSILLCSEEMMVILSQDHPAAQNESVNLASLEDESWVVSQPNPIRTHLIEICHNSGFNPHIVAESQLAFEVLSMVAEGVGVSIAPSITWLYKQRYDIAIRPIADFHYKRYLYAILPEGIPPTKATWDFIDFLQDFVGEANTRS